MILAKLTNEQIVDLIFEKEILIDNIRISSKDSGLCILSALDQRLRDGKIFRNQNTVLFGNTHRKGPRNRIRIDDRIDSKRREKINGSV